MATRTWRQFSSAALRAVPRHASFRECGEALRAAGRQWRQRQRTGPSALTGRRLRRPLVGQAVPAWAWLVGVLGLLWLARRGG